MKRVFYLSCFSHDGTAKYYVSKNGHRFSITLFPAKATLFDSYELAACALKHFPMFIINALDVKL